MSVVATKSVFCDLNGPKCSGWIAQRPTAEEARQVAKAWGWSRDDGKDICPECQREPGDKAGASE